MTTGRINQVLSFIGNLAIPFCVAYLRFGLISDDVSHTVVTRNHREVVQYFAYFQ